MAKKVLRAEDKEKFCNIRFCLRARGDMKNKTRADQNVNVPESSSSSGSIIVQ
jgi:hypothetical protein